MGKRTVLKWALVAGAIVIVTVVIFFFGGQGVAWVGHTDLEVRFVVTDAQSGQPIPNAAVHVHAQPGGFCEECGSGDFTLTTDENGRSSRLCKSCMCFGSKSMFEDSFDIHVPDWQFHVTAAGYSSTASACLEEWQYRKNVERGKPAILPIALQMQRTPE